MTVQAHRMSSIGRVLMALAVLWGIIGLSDVRSWAQESEDAHATLRGVEGVYVIVENFKPEVERAGLTREQLQTDVELRLRKAGIRVFTYEETLKTPGNPMLYVNVNVYLASDGLGAFNISVEFHQFAFLVTNGSLDNVITWNVGYTGIVRGTRVATLRDPIKDQVDRFINAYLSVNPRPAGSAAPASTSPRRDLIRQVQERLQTVGFNPGAVDGAIGPQTQQALRWFQNTKGLRSTGDLDEPTLNALGVR